MGTLSVTKGELRRVKIAGDDGRLYTSFRFVNGTLKSSDNKIVQSLVAEYILSHKDLHGLILENDLSVQDYCKKIKKDKSSGGQAELRALAMISHLSIHVISIRKTMEGQVNQTRFNYNAAIEPFQECVYLLYDEDKKSYTPLCKVDKNDSHEISTLFQRNDQVVDGVLEEFQLGTHCDDDFIEFDHEGKLIETVRSTETILKENEALEKMLVPQVSIDLRNKRKITDHNNLSLGGSRNADGPSSSAVNNNNVRDKPNKRTKVDTNHAKRPSSVNRSTNEAILPVNEQVSTDSSINAGENHQEQGMKFEVQPAKQFRGRTPGDFLKPKKALKRNGQPTTPWSSRPFHDRHGNRSLNLLIPERYLSINTEHSLRIHLVTRKIKGVTYVHPYFKFQMDRTNKQILAQNPIDIPFNPSELQQHSPEMKQLPLELVVMMLKNPQLMQVQQPLQIFATSNPGSAITTKYPTKRAFKAAYHLHDLRFAVTLCKRQPGEAQFRPSDDMQCISQITTETPSYEPKQ